MSDKTSIVKIGAASFLAGSAAFGAYQGVQHWWQTRKCKGPISFGYHKGSIVTMVVEPVVNVGVDVTMLTFVTVVGAVTSMGTVILLPVLIPWALSHERSKFIRREPQ